MRTVVTPWWSIMTQKSLRRVSQAARMNALAMLNPSSAQYTCRSGTLRATSCQREGRGGYTAQLSHDVRPCLLPSRATV